jgi:hypothetical protein
MVGSRPGYARPPPDHGNLLILIVALFSSRLSRAREDWKSEVPWMSLYFSLGVWCSVSLV